MSNIGNKQTMAKNLLYYVERSGRTQKELAEIVGVATSTFNDWLKAKKYPRIDKIEIMADYFGILKSDLIEEKSAEREQITKKSSTIADAAIRMKTDEEFMSLVEMLIPLDAEKIGSVKQLLSTFLK